MARVSVSIPDPIVSSAKTAGLNISRLATAALVDELDRLAKVAALDSYLTEMEAILGPIPIEAAEAAQGWVDEIAAAGRTHQQ